jgi:putative aldouronate transport system permease protein
LPAIAPTIITMLILRVGDIMSVGFEKVYLMQNGMNLAASEIISTYEYQVGLAGSSTNFSYAAAIGLFNSVINLIMIMIVNKAAKKMSGTSLW